MGLADRDYIRDVQPRRGAYGRGGWTDLRLWSVNTWLIVICVAVFVLDNLQLPGHDPLLPERDVPTGKFDQDRLYQLDPSTIVLGPHYAQQAVQLPDGRVATTWWRSVHERSTGRFIGMAEVYRMHFLESFLHFSTKLGFLRFEWWRFVGFQFLHATWGHLFFNMLALFFFGPMVEQYLGSKRYLAFYLLCGICGATMYLSLNLGGYIASLYQIPVRIPFLLFDDPSTPLVGASAGIFGVLMAGAYIAPRDVVYLFFVLPLLELRTFAYLLLALAIFTLFTGGENAGGQAGHLGGAIAGFYFIRKPYHLHGFFDLLGRVDPTSHHYRGRTARARGGKQSNLQIEIDRILAKIKDHGLHSLTESEKRTLRDAAGHAR